MYYFSKTTNGFYSPLLHGTNIPQDCVEITDEQHAALLEGQSGGRNIVADAGGYPVLQDPPAPTPDQLKAWNVAAIQAEMDRQAQAKGYDNIISACTYAMQPMGAPFQAEGAAFVAWRSQVWSQAYTMLAQVEAGTQPMPTPAQAVAIMPKLELPA